VHALLSDRDVGFDHFCGINDTIELVELSAAAGHPDVQREHIVMPPEEYFVTYLNDQLVALVIEPLVCMVRVGGGFLQNGVRGDHLPVLADTEMFKGALGLSSPELILSPKA
jgi:hypothetical protein